MIGGVGSELTKLQTHITSLSSSVQKISANFEKMSSAMGPGSGGTGMSRSSTGSNMAAISALAKGAGGAGGSGGGGMGGGDDGGLISKIPSMKPIMKAVNFAAEQTGKVLFSNMPSPEGAIARNTANYKWDMMGGFSGRPASLVNASLRNRNPNSISSSGSVNTMMAGFAGMGFNEQSMGQSKFMDFGSSAMRMHDYGIGNAEMPGFYRDLYSAPKNNALKMMLGPDKGTLDASGDTRSPEDIAQGIANFTMPDMSNMSPEDMAFNLQPDRAVDINLRETGQEALRPMIEQRVGAYTYLAENKDVKEKLEASGMDIENLTQHEVDAITGINDDVNPANLADELERKKASGDAALDASVEKGVRDAQDAQMKYLHFLENLDGIRSMTARMLAFMADDAGDASLSQRMIGVAGDMLMPGEQKMKDANEQQMSEYEDYLADPTNEKYQTGGAMEYVAENYRTDKAISDATGGETPWEQQQKIESFIADENVKIENQDYMGNDELERAIREKFGDDYWADLASDRGADARLPDHDLAEPAGSSTEPTDGSTEPAGSLTASKAPFGSGLTVSSALGRWNVEQDTESRIHQGEMIIPSRIATQIRKDLSEGGRPIQETPQEVLGSINTSVDAAIQNNNFSPTFTRLGSADLPNAPVEHIITPTHTSETPALAHTPETPKPTHTPEPTTPPTNPTPPPPINLTFNVSVQRASEAEVQYLASRIQQVLAEEQSLISTSTGVF